MKRLNCLLIISLMALFILTSCSRKVHKAESKKTDLADGINSFGIEMYTELTDLNKENVFFSPLSVSQALAMTQAGARGKTAEEMQKVLRTGDSPEQTANAFASLNKSLIQEEGSVKLMLANALWPQKNYKFLPEYFNLIQDQYKAGIEYIKYGDNAEREKGRKQINNWVSKKTAGHIKDLVPENAIGPSTRLVLTNAIYFLGVWEQSFDPQLSVELPFMLLSGENAMVYFMSRTDDAMYYSDEDVKVLELPYDQDRLVMDIILPAKKGGLAELEEKFNPTNYNKWIGGMKAKPVVTLIPRWRSEASFELGKPLLAMGMRSPFSTDADFSGMTGSKDIFISRVIHKAFIEVTEKGTEAAAATAVTMKETVAEPNTDQVFFRADHPFIYVIRDKESGVIIFAGRLVNPSV